MNSSLERVLNGAKDYLKGRKTLKMLFKPITDNTNQRDIKQDILKRAVEVAAGIESELKNPDALLDDKNKDLTLYDLMMTDDKIKFGIEFKKTMTMHVPHSIVAGSDEEIDEEIAEEVRNNFDELKQPTFDDVLDNLQDSSIYGHKEGEIIYKLEEGKYRWEGVRFQHPILFDFVYDENDELESVAYGHYYGNKENIPAEVFHTKFLYMVNPYMKDGNYYGDSDLRELYFEWWSKFNIARQRNKYLQNFGMPVPEVIYDTAKMSVAELTALKNTMQNWQESMYLIIPGNADPVTKELRGKFQIKWVEFGEGKGADQFNASIEFINKAILRKLEIPDKQGFTDDGAGSFAQSEQLTELMFMSIEKRHRRIEEVINNKVRFLVDLNYPNVENYPKFKFEKMSEVVKADLLKLMIDAKIIDRREPWLRKWLKVPELTEQEQADIDVMKEEDKIEQQEIFERNAQSNINSNGNRPNRSNGNSNSDVPPSNQVKMKANTKKIEKQLDVAENDFLLEYNTIMKDQEERLIKIIERKKIIENRDYKALKKLQMQKTELKKQLSLYYAKLYLMGKVDAIEEVNTGVKKGIGQKFKYIHFQGLDDAWLDKDWINRTLAKHGELGILTKADKEFLVDLRDRAFFVTGEKEEATLKLIYNAVNESIIVGEPLKTATAKIRDLLAEDRKKHALTIARTNASSAYNSGRLNEFTSPQVAPFIDGYMYDAIMDGSTTDFCREHNGQFLKAGDSELMRITPPNHFNCRSILTPVFVGEDVDYDFGTGIDAGSTASTPAEGFGGSGGVDNK